MMRIGLLLLVMMVMFVTTTSAADSSAWLTDLNASCAKTTEAMDLSREELQVLIAQSERVKKAIESQDESVRKVHLKRVQMCLDLFRYVLESKETDSGKGQQPKSTGESGR